MLENPLLELVPKGCAPGNQTGSNFFLNLQKIDGLFFHLRVTQTIAMRSFLSC